MEKRENHLKKISISSKFTLLYFNWILFWINSVDEEKKSFTVHFMNLLFIYSDGTSMALSEGQHFE